MIWTLFIVQNVVLPIVIAYGVLWIDQHWHGKIEFNRAYARTVSLGVNAKTHPEKVTLDAMYIASQAELNYACGLLDKDFKEVKQRVKWDIKHQLSMEGKFIPIPEGEHCYCICHHSSSSCPSCKHCGSDAAIYR